MERKEVENACKNSLVFPLLKQTEQMTKNLQLNSPAGSTVKPVSTTSEVQEQHIPIM